MNEPLAISVKPQSTLRPTPLPTWAKPVASGQRLVVSFPPNGRDSGAVVNPTGEALLLHAENKRPSPTAFDFLKLLVPENANGFLDLQAYLSDKTPGPRKFIKMTSAAADVEIEEFIRPTGAKFNLYMGVAERRKATKSTKGNCSRLRAVFIDIDFKETPEAEARPLLAAFALPPSVVVHSGNGLHVYWLLREPIDLDDKNVERVESVLKRLAKIMRADPGVTNVNRLLRIPGTLNHKYDPPRLATIETWGPRRQYTYDDIDGAVPAAEQVKSAAKAQIENINGAKPQAAALTPHPRPSLSPEMERRLSTGDYSGRYRSRSELIQGLALAFVNAGRTFPEYVEAIMASAAGEKLQGRQDAEKYLGACWEKAVQRFREQPPQNRGQAAQEQMSRLLEAALEPSIGWSGRGGATDWAVLLAHIALNQLGAPTYYASVRTVGDLAGVTAETAGQAHRRLQSRGWLVPERRGKGTDAHEWRLEIPRHGSERDAFGIQPDTFTSSGGCKECVRDCTEPVTEPVTGLAAHAPTRAELQALRATGPLTNAERARRYRARKRATQQAANASADQGPGPLDADAFRADGLGHVTQRVLRLLSLETPVTTAVLVLALKISDSGVRHHLRKLKRRGLAKKEGGGWVRTGRAVDEVADDLGVAGTGARQRLQHEEDRALFKAWTRRNPNTPGKPIRAATERDAQLRRSHRAETMATRPPADARPGGRAT